MKEGEAQRLKTLEQENSRLKRIVADLTLDISYRGSALLRERPALGCPQLRGLPPRPTAFELWATALWARTVRRSRASSVRFDRKRSPRPSPMLRTRSVSVFSQPQLLGPWLSAAHHPAHHGRHPVSNKSAHLLRMCADRADKSKIARCLRDRRPSR